MANGNPSMPERKDESPHSFLDPERIAVWRPLGIAAVVGAAVGLSIGIFVGRATVTPPSKDEARASGPAVASPDKDLKEAKAEKTGGRVPPEPPAMPPETYVANLGRYLPSIQGSEGFKAELSENRPAARLRGTDARLRFSFEAVENKPYALAAIVQLEGANEARLEPSMDGHALGTWTLAKGWALYSSPASKELLAKTEHDLALEASGITDEEAVRVDSMSLVPVGADMIFNIGSESQGHLVDGFSNPGDRSVWSEGPRSVIGGVLAPKPKAYRLDVRSSAYHPLAPLSVVLRVNGKEVGTASVSKKVQDASWRIPPKVLREGVNELVFDYSQTGQPSQFDPGSKDERALAMRYYAVRLVPEG
jgi:hypothetical protein